MSPAVIIIIVGGAIFVILLFKALNRIAKKDAKSMTKKDAIQHKINRLARGTDEERWHAIGKSAKNAAKRKGIVGKLILACIIIIVILVALDVFL